MDKAQFEKVLHYVSAAAVYCPSDDTEDCFIDYYDKDTATFNCTGQESGMIYSFSFEDVNLETDMFYQLILMP